MSSPLRPTGCCVRLSRILLDVHLEPRGDRVLLVLNHLPVLERFEKQTAMGWHTFLDILTDTLAAATSARAGVFGAECGQVWGGFE